MKTQQTFYVKKAFVLLMAFIVPCVLLAQDLPTNRIFDILIDDSDLWIAGDVGVIKYDKITGEQTVYTPFKGEFTYSKTTLKLAKDHEENIWATSVHHGIAEFDGESWTIYSENQGNFPFDQWNEAIVIDKNNHKWIGNFVYLVKSDNTDNEIWKSWMTDCDFSSAPFITAMAMDNDDVLWIGGCQNPCTFGKFTGEGFEYYDIDVSCITQIIVDQRNNLWIASTNHGLIKYDNGQFTSYTTDNSDIPNNSIYDIKADKEGNLWLASGRYLVKFNQETFTKYEHPDIRSWIHCLSIEDNGDVWIGTHEDGFFLFSMGEFYPIELISEVAIDEPDKPAKNDFFTVFVNASDIVIDFSLTQSANVSLSVCDIQGKEVCNILRNNDLISGKHQYSCTHTRFPSGLYFVRYVVNGVADVKKVVIP